MKNLILAISAAVMVSSVATSAGMALQASPGADLAFFASVPLQSGTTTRLAMGPTSAPQKPGGVGKGSSETPKVHKKAMPNTNMRPLAQRGLASIFCSCPRSTFDLDGFYTASWRLGDCQKWKMRSLAAIAAQLREGGTPALALPLNAFAFSER